MNTKEFEIPVPWGEISARTWGNEENTPVLLLHGMSDNLGSFEPLMPYLRKEFYYISIDLPGHGKSSRFPPYVPVSLANFVLTTTLVMDYLKKDKFIIIGHSWSGHSMLLFALLYPERLLKLILLDVIFPYPLSITYFKQFLQNRINNLSRANSRKQLSFTYEEAFKKLQTNRMYGEATDEAIKALIDRSLTPLQNGRFVFTVDPRIRFFHITFFGKEFGLELIKKYPITCPTVFIIANHSPPSITYFRTFIKELFKNNSKCFVRTVNGNHDVHMNNPEKVAPIINAFLIYSNSKL